MRVPVDQLDACFRAHAGHAGVAATAELLRAGVTPAQVRTALRTGRWYVVARGVLALAPVPDVETERWLRGVAAAQLRSSLDTVARGRTAARVHGLPLLGGEPERPELTVVRGSARRHVPATTLSPEDVVEVRGVRVTSLTRTAVDVARGDTLLQGVVVLDAALELGASPADLHAAAARVATTRGRKQVAAALAASRRGAESPLETLGRVRLLDRGLPEPELQVELHDRRGRIGRVDHLWRRERVVAEADGVAKYRLRQVARPDADPLAEEKLRQLRLEDLGFEVVRYGWDEAWHRPDDLAAKVWAALDRGRRRTA